jgi:hypothetical protein
MRVISGILDAETAAAETEHGVELVQFVDAVHDFLDGDVELVGEIHLRLLGVRQEFVQRRIEETDGGREPFNALKMPKKSSR